MNTYSAKFENLIAEVPEGAAALRRLGAFWDGANVPHGAVAEFTVNRLMDIAAPVSLPTLVSLLSTLVQQNVLEKVLRVESPAAGGIQDFESIAQIPTHLHDWRTDRQLTVTPDLIKLIYRLH